MTKRVKQRKWPHSLKKTSELIKEKYDDLLMWQHKAVMSCFKNKKTFLFAPRQNGKTEVGLVFAMMCFNEGLRVLYTAHMGTTITEQYYKIEDYYGDDKTVKPQSGQGRERIKSTKHSGRINFLNRSRKAGVGQTFDVIIYDEAQFLESDHITALNPTIRTSKFRHVLFMGTAPEKIDSSYYIRKLHRTMHERPKENWILYGVSSEETAEREVFTKKCNPSLGELIDRDAIAEDKATYTYSGWLSECCCYWHTDEELRIFKSYKIYDGTANMTEPRIGIKISTSERLSVGCIGKAGGKWVAKYLYHGEIDNGIKQLKDWLSQRYVDGIYADSRVKEYLAGINTEFVTSTEFFNRTERFRQQMVSGDMYIDNQKEMISMITNCGKRVDKDSKGNIKWSGFGFQATRPDVNVECLEAIAMAAPPDDIFQLDIN